MDERARRARFRAWRRGFRELDLILGGFMDTQGARLAEADLAALERLLDEPDQDVYDWILQRAPTPQAHETELMHRLRAHCRAGVTRIEKTEP